MENLVKPPVLGLIDYERECMELNAKIKNLEALHAKEVADLKAKIERAKKINLDNIAAADETKVRLEGKIEALHDVIDNLIFELKK